VDLVKIMGGGEEAAGAWKIGNPEQASAAAMHALVKDSLAL
jgi:hypothetical protein